MAIFKLDALDGSASMLVRARCLSCARNEAVRADRERSKVWASRQHSTVELVRDPESIGIFEAGPDGVVQQETP